MSPCCVGNASSSQPGPSHFLFEDPWGGRRGEELLEEGGEVGKSRGESLKPQRLRLKESLPSERGNESLGSCGSLADSEGSVSPPIIQVPCCSIVVQVVDYDADKPTRINYPYPANFEDDVFLS